MPESEEDMSISKPDSQDANVGQDSIRRITYIGVVILILIVITIIIAVLGRTNEKKRPAATTATKDEAVASFNKGDFKKAIPKLKVYVSDHPGDFEARSVLAQSYWLDGRLKIAIGQYLKLNKARPKDADVLYRMGILYGQLKAEKKAVESLEKATKLRADQPVFLSELAKAYTRMSRYDRAVASWRRVLALTPENNVTLRANIFAEIGNVYVLKKDKVKAREAYNQGLAIEPQNEYLKKQLEMVGS